MSVIRGGRIGSNTRAHNTCECHMYSSISLNLSHSKSNFGCVVEISLRISQIMLPWNHLRSKRNPSGNPECALSVKGRGEEVRGEKEGTADRGKDGGGEGGLT